jgi:acyl-coenzyme A synthetase/AMP-(fatty) acid ligase
VDLSYEALMAEAPESFEVVKTYKEDYAIMHYTSGTTGKPKGAELRRSQGELLDTCVRRGLRSCGLANGLNSRGGRGS